MKNLYLTILLVWICSVAIGQTKLSGTVTDSKTGMGIPGSNILIKGTLTGTHTDADGSFNLETTQNLPITLQVSFVGYQKVEIQVSESNSLKISLEPTLEMLNEVVFSASRIEEPLFQSAITVEKMDLRTLKNAPSMSIYDGIQNLRGVDVVTSGITYKQYNTRGFNSTGNARFLQLIDGVDNQPPGLNFAIGSMLGIGDLDIESVELVPGSASALYGPAAFNGVLMMRSKDPFLYQGLSVQAKTGVNHVNNPYTNAAPFGDFGLRYATVLGNKFAIKINGAYFSGLDWYATNYTDIDAQTPPENRGDHNPARDALNIYGDEVARTIPGVGRVARTGYEERFVMDYNSYSAKFSTSLHYRFSENMEISYAYNMGKGRAAYTGSNRFMLNNFMLQQHKLELKGSNYFVRGYVVTETSNDSYNSRALGQHINRTWVRDLSGNIVSPNEADNVWFERYEAAFLGQMSDVAAGNHSLARAFADEGRVLPETAEFEALKTRLVGTQGMNGAGIFSNSKFYQAEGQYDFSNDIKVIDVQVGGSLRYYDMFTNGTLFNDVNNPITIKEGGVYIQASKKLMGDRLKLTASQRYDKNENFEGRFTPRAMGLFQLTSNQNIRASYQTGFRNPTPADQFIHLNVGPIVILGGAPSNSAGMNVYENSFTANSVGAFGAAFGAAMAQGASFEQALMSNKDLLQQSDVDYIKPERVTSYEVGYRGVFANKFTVDANYYYGKYTDFLMNTVVIRPEGNVTLPDGTINPGAAGNILSGNIQAFQLYNNAEDVVSAQGATLALGYSLAKGYQISANGTWASFDIRDADPNNIPAFNTPEFKTVLSFSNFTVTERFGFSLAWRWQDSFDWYGSFTQMRPGRIEAFSLVDAQVSYRIPQYKTIVKIGANNILNSQVYQAYGSPSIGGLYFVSLTFDEMLR